MRAVPVSTSDANFKRLKFASESKRALLDHHLERLPSEHARQAMLWDSEEGKRVTVLEADAQAVKSFISTHCD